MDNNNEKKTKELELGTDTTTTEEKKPKETTKSKARVVGNEDTNSFYDGGSDKNSSAWLTDWRGKTLIFFILLLIIIGISIPSGMALAGYFGIEDNDYDFTSIEGDTQIEKDFENLQNDAIVWYFDELHDQGFYSDKYFNNLKDDAEEDVDDQISDEKDSAKDTYGDEYSDPWQHSLEEKGFDTEDQYRASLLSNKYKSEEVNEIVNESYFTKNVITEDGVWNEGAIYHSKASKLNNFVYISDDAAINSLINDDEEVNHDILSPEELVSLYLDFYQPIVFNSTLVDFTTSGDDDAASLDPNNISVTEDQLINLLNLSDASQADTPFENFKPQNYKEGEIQSLSSITISDAADLAIYSLIADQLDETPKRSWDAWGSFLKDLNDAADTLDNGEDDIKAMTSSEIDDAGKKLLGSLKTNYLLESTTDGTYNRTLYSTTTINEKDYITYFDTDGIHLIGITEYAKSRSDETIVSNYLNNKNDSGDDYLTLEDTGLWDSYSSFVTKYFNYIVLWQALEADVVFSDGGFASNYVTSQEDYTLWAQYLLNNKATDLVDSKYFAMDTYISTNKDIYGYNVFKTDKGLFEATKQFELISFIKDGYKLNTATDALIIKGGDDDE